MQICIVMNVALRKIHKIKEIRVLLSENMYCVVTIRHWVRVPGSLCPQPIWQQGRFLHWVHKKLEKKPFPISGTRSGVGPGEGRHIHQGSQSSTLGGAERRSLSFLAGERRDWLGSRPTQSVQKFGKLAVHFDKASGLSHTQADIIPGEQRNSVLPGLARGTLTLLPWPMASSREPRALLPTWWCTPSRVHKLSRPWAHNHEALAATWPVAVQTPGDSRKQTAARNKLRYLEGE